jgi:putative membrane protein
VIGHAAAAFTPWRASRHTKVVGFIVAAGFVESVIVGLYPGHMPFWAPYEFSWGVYLSCALSIVWYVRGLGMTSVEARPGPWRRAAFFIGVGVIYLCMQTWFDYAAQHMFFIHRLQHLFLHHTGPLLVALSNPGEAIWRGMPEAVRRPLRRPWLRKLMNGLQQPALAAFLFVGLIYLWPMPPVHFRAMLDPKLYTVMNWSVTIDGILFWALILDPKPKPLARISYAARFICVLVVMFPQIILGALVAFAERDIYPVYEICGRILPMTGLEDQSLAGLILWIPSSMMSIVGAIVVLNFMRLNDETRAKPEAGKPAYV